MTNKNRIKELNILLFVVLLIAIFSTSVYSAQDFIIENKTSALFVVNGTTGNIFMTPSFENKVMLL